MRPILRFLRETASTHLLADDMLQQVLEGARPRLIIRTFIGVRLEQNLESWQLHKPFFVPEDDLVQRQRAIRRSVDVSHAELVEQAVPRLLFSPFLHDQEPPDFALLGAFVLEQQCRNQLCVPARFLFWAVGREDRREHIIEHVRAVGDELADRQAVLWRAFER